MSKLNKILSELFADILFEDTTDIVINHISNKFNIDEKKIRNLLDENNCDCNCLKSPANLEESNNVQNSDSKEKIESNDLPNDKYLFENQIISIESECFNSYPCYHKVHHKKENIVQYLSAEDILDMFYSKDWVIPSHFNYITGDSQIYKEESSKDNEILYYLNINGCKSGISFRKSIEIESEESIPITLKLINHLRAKNNFGNICNGYHINILYGPSVGIFITHGFVLNLILNDSRENEEQIFMVPKKFTDEGSIDMTGYARTALIEYFHNLYDHPLLSKKNFLKYNSKTPYVVSPSNIDDNKKF